MQAIRVLVTGGRGRLAQALAAASPEVTTLPRSRLDITDPGQIERGLAPTPIGPLAERLLALCRRLARGDNAIPPILHMAGSPPGSRADWVSAAFDLLAEAGIETPPLRRVPMASFPSTLARPNFSALDSSATDSLFGAALDWRAGLADCIRAGVYSDISGT